LSNTKPTYTYHLTGRPRELDDMVHIYKDGKPCYGNDGGPLLAPRETVNEIIKGFAEVGTSNVQ